jgi:hypothetical protein
MRARCALWSLAGPGAFGLAARLGGRIEPGYSRRDEPISALAAKGSRAARVMIPGFLGLAAGSVGLAKELRGSAVAPNPVPALLALAGLTTAGAGLARCSDRSCPTRLLGDHNVTRSDDLHAGFSAATFARWIAIPLVAARRAGDAGPRYRRWCRRLGGATLIGLVGGGMLARRPSQSWSGAAQRVMLTSALSWYLWAGIMASISPKGAVALSRRVAFRTVARQQVGDLYRP